MNKLYKYVDILVIGSVVVTGGAVVDATVEGNVVGASVVSPTDIKFTYNYSCITIAICSAQDNH